MSGYVYAIGSRNAVKIGWAKDPVRRLSELNVGSPDNHELLGVVAATREQERELHLLLSRHRVRGEWFDRSAKAVLHFISNLRPVARRERSCYPDSALKAWRKERGITLGAFSKEVGASPSLLSRVENGNARPSISTLAKICRATEGAVSLSDFCEAAE